MPRHVSQTNLTANQPLDSKPTPRQQTNPYWREAGSCINLLLFVQACVRSAKRSRKAPRCAASTLEATASTPPVRLPPPRTHTRSHSFEHTHIYTYISFIYIFMWVIYIGEGTLACAKLSLNDSLPQTTLSTLLAFSKVNPPCFLMSNPHVL